MEEPDRYLMAITMTRVTYLRHIWNYSGGSVAEAIDRIVMWPIQHNHWKPGRKWGADDYEMFLGRELNIPTNSVLEAIVLESEDYLNVTPAPAPYTLESIVAGLEEMKETFSGA